MSRPFCDERAVSHSSDILFFSKVASSWAEGGEFRQQGDPLSPSLGLMAGGGLVGYSHYPAYATPPQYRRAPEGQEFRRGGEDIGNI